MAQTGYTPIQLYYSTTASTAPLAASLANGELAINITDGKLFYKDNSAAVQVIGWKTTPTSAGGTGLTSYTAGDTLYYASGTTLTKLAIGTAYQAFQVNAGATAPSWQPSATSVLTTQGDLLYASSANTLARLAKDANATRYLSNTGTTNNPAWAQINLANGVTGTLPVANGGTNLTSYTANGVVYASSTSALTTGSALAFNGSKLGIGVSSFDVPLQVQAITGGLAMRFNGRASPADGYSDIAFFNSANTTQYAGIGAANSGLYLATNISAPIVFQINSTTALTLDSSGGLILVGSTAQKATGTTWSNPSDQRLKDNIRDYAKGTTELMQVRVREWEYNGKGGTIEGTKGLGVVADEVMTVLPDTVENYDAKLNDDDEEITKIKKFDATEITWLLVKTAQEQQTLITQLTARITALEGA